MTAAHRQTAADWHATQHHGLYAFAKTGVVHAGIEGEIDDVLAAIERGDVGASVDRVEEHARLLALHRHVEPELARQRAGAFGVANGQVAGGLWRSDILQAEVLGPRRVVATQLLARLEDGDPELRASTPAWYRRVTPREVLDGAGWAEPPVDDRAGHHRWSEATHLVLEAHESGFADGYWEEVAASCNAELDRSSGVEVGAPDAAATDAAWQMLVRLEGLAARAGADVDRGLEL